MQDQCQLIRTTVDAIPFFDTHSHLAGMDFGTPVDDKAPRSLNQILYADYLAYLADSCTDAPAAPNSADALAEFEARLPLLDACRGLTTYAALREGIRELHPFSEADLSTTNFAAVNASIMKAYTTHGERHWQRLACRRVNVVRQTHMAQLAYVVDHLGALPPAEREAQLAIQLPSLILDGFFFSGFVVSREGFQRAKAIIGGEPQTFRQHLQLCDTAVARFVEGGGGSVKLLSAYHRTLRFEKVPEAEAAALYQLGPENLSPDQLHRLQDAIVWALLRIARRRNLPLIVHCGYANPTDHADAEHLRNLLTDPELRGLRIDLCHSNWPRQGAAMILARTYRGAYFNLCWTPLLSESLAARILSEAVDIVPMNKILLGTDCATAESFVGTTRIVRRVLARVLVDKVRQGQFDATVAARIARCLLHDNAVEFYGAAAGRQRLQ